MLFNSFAFLIFLPIIFFAYWSPLRKSLRAQNFLILAGSYLFYGWWDYRFLSLIFLSSLLDFHIGKKLILAPSAVVKKFLLGSSLLFNLGALGVFKYFNFFVDSFSNLLRMAGLNPNEASLHIILPVGISFYTFQTLSYSIDIYRGKLKPTDDWVEFFAFVSFFPQLVAGPIERASALLPQFSKARIFDQCNATNGLRQILWGLFKKVVIADNLSSSINSVFGNYSQKTPPELVIAIFLFAIQIYCDFSGYSDIAIGTARLFGFSLKRNFAFPYFSRDIAEFWQRWHISLSSWFRDYVFIPLGGSRTSSIFRIRNIIITFTVSGLWHGANWTFVFWGLLNGLYYLPLMLKKGSDSRSPIVAAGSNFPSFQELGEILTTFGLTLLAWTFFRANSMSDALGILSKIFTENWGNFSTAEIYLKNLLFAFVLLVIEWFMRDRSHGLEIGHFPQIVRWPIYLAVACAIAFLGKFESAQFIYFQF